MKLEQKRMVVPFTFETKQDDPSSEFFEFEGYASTFGDVDRGDDVVVKGAFRDSVIDLMKREKEAKLPVLWQHRYDEPIGVYTHLMEDEKGLFVRGRLPKSDAQVRDKVVPQMKAGSVDSMSIGYSCDISEYDSENEVRLLKKLTLYEISLVTVPMNPNAIVTHAKGATRFGDLPIADQDMQWDSSAAIERVREWAGAEDEPNARYRKAFFWFDSEEAGEFGSYKLPFADIVDDELVAVPRGIFAAAAAMRGARGGVDLPDSDRPGVVRHIARYYSKMDMESPFQERSSFRIDKLDSLTPKSLESLLRSGVYMSENMAKRVVSSLKEHLYRDGEDESTREVDGKGLDIIHSALTKLSKTVGEKNV